MHINPTTRHFSTKNNNAYLIDGILWIRSWDIDYRFAASFIIYKYKLGCLNRVKSIMLIMFESRTLVDISCIA